MPLPCCIEKWPTIPEDEPVFVLRGKDKLASEVVRFWIALASQNGVNDAKMDAVLEHLHAIDTFQREHPERCKIPD